MKWNEVFCHTFKVIHEQLGLNGEAKPMVDVAYDSDFCQEVVSKGWLTDDQMRHAADRYRLGKSKSGKCIFWMLDEMQQVRDGHLGDTWVSLLLKARQPQLLKGYYAQHCLFGLHLLNTPAPIAVIESPQSAVILSELFPDFIWMAYIYAANMTPDAMEPLQGRTVTIFPRTDPTLDTYLSFLDFADGVRRLYHIDIAVDNTLEENATPEQKEREIDLVDYIFEV